MAGRGREPTISAPAPLGDRYVAAAVPTTVRFYIPAKCQAAEKGQRRRELTIEGTLKGAMHMRGAVHHYRVAGNDGILYLAPVAWFPPGHVEWFMKEAFVPKSDPAKQARINALIDVLVSLHTSEPVA